MNHSFAILSSLIFAFLLSTCTHSSQNVAESTHQEEARQEARDDSLELVAAYERQAKISISVSPSFETDAIASDNVSDAADDPAIWVHPTEPEKSILIGSNKKGGLHLYDLQGKEIAYFPIGNVNNVDLLPEFQLGEERIVLVGGRNRTDQSIDLLKLDPSGPTLTDISADALQVDGAEIDDIYGFCLYQDQSNGLSYAFINGKNGRVQQFELVSNENGKVAVKKVRDIRFDSQVEGMVADDQHGVLYVGEEGRGIWKVAASAEGGQDKTLIEMSGEENPAISYDIEGLAIYKQGTGGYLLASSQGNFSYAVFERTGENAYLGSFTIGEANGVDGAEETDGIETSSASLGDAFPRGLLIVQDGFNYEGDALQPQNFKVVDWREIESNLFTPPSND